MVNPISHQTEHHYGKNPPPITPIPLPRLIPDTHLRYFLLFPRTVVPGADHPHHSRTGLSQNGSIACLDFLLAGLGLPLASSNVSQLCPPNPDRSSVEIRLFFAPHSHVPQSLKICFQCLHSPHLFSIPFIQGYLLTDTRVGRRTHTIQ